MSITAVVLASSIYGQTCDGLLKPLSGALRIAALLQSGAAPERMQAQIAVERAAAPK